MHPDHVSQRDGIVQAAQSIAAVDLNQLLDSRKIGTELSFKTDEDVFTRCIDLARHITAENLERLSPHYFHSLSGFVRDVGSALHEARAFSANRPDALEHRNRIVGRLDQAHREVLQQCPGLPIIYAAEGTKSLVSLLQAQNDFSTKSVELFQSFERRAKDQEAQIAEILNKARQASQEVAVRGYAQYFQDEATAAKTTAERWLKATAALSAALFVSLVGLAIWLSVFPPLYTMLQAVIAGAAKLVVFSVAIFFVTWCGRNYKAQWHVYITNKHRANALNSLEAFANASKSDANREAILVHACAAIFSQTATGFVPDAADAPAMPSILEVVRRTGD